MNSPNVEPNAKPNVEPAAKSLLPRAAALYVLMGVVALVWNFLRGRGMPLYPDASLLGVICYGVAAALLTFSLGLAAYRLLPTMREITREMSALIVSGAGRTSLLALALLSGVGEEMLFRGTLQAEFGIVIASMVFGLLHVGPGLKYLWWTGYAVAGGFLYGGLYEITGGILAPMLAHVLHNAATMLYWKAKLSPGPHPDSVP